MNSNGDVLRCVQVNVGCASPSVKAKAREAMLRWADVEIESRPALVFAQEVSDAWLELWARAEYRVVEATLDADWPLYRVRSALIVDTARLPRVDPLQLPEQRYHGSYLAAALVGIPDLGAITCVSVHASPSKAAPYLGNWNSEVPDPRTGGGGYASALWDSDMVLATLASLAATGPVLAAGDLNEARGWDDVHGGTWGELYFRAIETAGLVDVTHRRWEKERRTHKDGLQLDHVLARSDVAATIGPADVDCSETFDGVAATDHAPIRFDVVPAGAP